MVVKMNTKLYFCISFELLSFVLANPITEVSGGWIQGLARHTPKGTPYHVYLGIPFAEPPVGKLRFQEPLPAKSWQGIRKANKEGPTCAEYHISYRKLYGDEDCLYLNVYTPIISRSNDALFPVLVYIHSGGFVTGNTNDTYYAPTWFMDEEMVAVTINYRVGVFGFLSLDIKEAPGNAGLKDQVAALRWMKENIAAFGGDPDHITIFGTDAGAASVNYLMASERTKGLFDKAIMSSGSALNPWTHVHNATENAFKICNVLGHRTNNTYNALKFLLKVPQYDLLAAVGEPPHSNLLSDMNLFVRDIVFLPVIEKKFPGGSKPVITQSIRNKMESGNFIKVPIMAGFNTEEGSDVVQDAETDPVLYGLTDANFERYIPREMCLKDGSQKSRNAANKIKNFYYGDRPVNASSLRRFIALKGDTWFKIGINEMVKLIAKHSTEPVYYYRFSFYEPGQTLSGDSYKYDTAGHGDDLIYVLDFKSGIFYNTTRIGTVSRRLVKLYANFVKTGNPTPKITKLLPVTWQPVTRDELNYLSIDEDLTMSKNPDKKRLQFWEQLIEQGNDCGNKP